jgi:hypothetical protein
MLVVLRPREDDQGALAFKVATAIDKEEFIWEELNYSWFLLISKETISIKRAHGSKEVRLLSSEVSLYLRCPVLSGDDPWLLPIYETLQAMATRVIGEPILLDHQINSKARELIQLEKYSPHTRILTTPSWAPLGWVVKGLSPSQRTTAVIVRERLSSERSATPLLVQEFIEGEEWKVNVHFRSEEPSFFIIKSEDSSADFRHDLLTKKTLLKRVDRAPRFLKKLAHDLKKKFRRSHFDFDLRFGRNLKVLEVNDSPNATLYENILGEVDFTFTRTLLADSGVVVLSTLDDKTSKDFLEEVSTKEPVIHLDYDQFDKDWTFSLASSGIVFFAERGWIFPEAIYDRGVNAGSSQKKLHSFIQALNATPQKVVGRPSIHFRNGSKALQLSSSLCDVDRKMKLPATRILRTKRSFEEINLSQDTIVKSISGIRTIVVDHELFSKWNQKGLEAAPVLFQSRISGNSLRLHWMENPVWLTQIKSEGTLDYRYGGRAPSFQTMSLDENIDLVKFAQRVAEVEDNQVLGLDFIQDAEGNVFCLEANPGPGWSYFEDQPNSNFRSHLATALLNHLLGRKRRAA